MGRRRWYSSILQGNCLIDIAEFSEESLRLPCEAADGGSEIDGSSTPQPVEGRVAQGRQVLGRVTPENRAAILIQRRVAYVVQAVLDRGPVLARQLLQPLRVGLRASQRRDVVGRLGLPGAPVEAFADQAADLAHLRPVELLIQADGARQRPSLAPAMTLVTRRGGLSFRLPLPLLVGGKRPRPARRIPARFPAVNRADSL